MAVNDIIAEGLGFNASQPGWLLTLGFGDFSEPEASGDVGNYNRRRRSFMAWVVPFVLFLPLLGSCLG